VIALTAFTLAPHTGGAASGFENGESEMMLPGPIFRIIDRGYVFTIF